MTTVFFRLPDTRTAVKITQRGDPEKLTDIGQLGMDGGYVFAPFAPDADCPVLLVRPDSVEIIPLAEAAASSSAAHTQPHDGASAAELAAHTAAERTAYYRDFAAFHAALCAGDLQKVVLARRSTRPSTLDTDADAAMERLFLTACARYPHMYIALIQSPACGTWLTATPEVLLQHNGAAWHTMALAGTLKAGDAQCTWSEKNIKEQRYVADYIEDTLRYCTTSLTVSEAHDLRAAALLHRCTDFHFQLDDAGGIGRLLARLHPTPAVCGMPKTAARRFILARETAPRKYYSGFTGPLRLPVDGLAGHTHLFVMLRCMQILPQECHLYAGGGLLAESDEQSEWEETEAKMAAMEGLLGGE